MITLLFALALTAAAPPTVTIVTPAGERRVPVTTDARLGALVPAGPTLGAIGGTSQLDGIWAEVRVGQMPFRFLLGAPLYTVSGGLYTLASLPTLRGDSLFLPLQFLSDALPRHLGSRFRWDARASRLIDAGERPAAPSATRVASASTTTPAADAPKGLFRRTHRVTIDPGHGGVDPGNPGLYFPRGVREKDVTLDLGLLVSRELRYKGVQVTMTRTRDTLIDLRDRGRYCASDCDLFVSLHVNSLPRRSGFTSVRGFETYFLAEARTEDAARVARMENEAIRFEQPKAEDEASGLDFILKDLQLNEYLRESGRAAALIQRHLGEVHSGEDRGVKQAGLIVLNTARRPAVLVEVGFSTNRADARLMAMPDSQKKLARAIAEAIVQYLLEYERKTGDAPLGPAGQ
jgi:N-acetylmuramoyl-L-alanine amidase